jgi:hypothetical protein
MKVLTLHQPYATLVALGVKTIETRGWATNVRGRIAIHAGVRPVTREHVGEWYVDRTRRDGSWMRRSTLDPSLRLPLGAIVATANLVDCVPILEDSTDSISCIELSGGSAYLWREGDELPERSVRNQLPYGDYEPGWFAWLLADVERLDVPVPFKGGDGLSKTWEPAA